MSWKNEDNSALYERTDGACVYQRCSGGWGWRGPGREDFGGASKRSAEAAMAAVDARWPDPEPPDARLDALAQEAHDESRRRPGKTTPKGKPWSELSEPERVVWRAIVRRVLEASRRPSTAAAPARHASEIPDLVVPPRSAEVPPPELEPLPDPTTPADLRAGLTYVQVSGIDFGACNGGSGCTCEACSTIDALICACGRPWLDHGDPDCEGDQRAVFRLASWRGGPPPPAQAPSRASLAAPTLPVRNP